MLRTFIKQPNKPSNGARDLARALGVRMIRRTNSRYVARDNDVIINWGNPAFTTSGKVWYINHPTAVCNAIDKRAAWVLMQEAGVPTVEWTQDKSDAWKWIMDDQRVLVRTSLRASQGKGMTAHSLEGTKWTDDAYTMADDATYVKVFGRNPQHVTEYRVHVVDGQVIDYVQKMRRRDYEQGSNPYIRSHGNGWVFARSDVILPTGVNEAALQAVAALGLDFGAVDCAADREGRVCVYEINTAPGLEGTTLDSYAKAFAG